MRLGALGVVALAWVSLGCPPPAKPPPPPAESVFFLVRHAEKAGPSDEAPLTEEGRERARVLAAVLRDAGVERIHSSDFVRTRETAAPLASELGLEVTLYDSRQVSELTDTLLSSPGRSLVVGHSNTTPELTRLLGGEPGSPIAESEYDRLYVLVRRPGVGTSTILLRVGPG